MYWAILLQTARWTVKHDSLVDLLRLRARSASDECTYTFLETGEVDGPATSIDNAGLDARARAIAVAIGREVEPGARAILLFPPGLDYIAAFWGCLYGGIIAVPAYPPEPHRFQQGILRLQEIVADAEPGCVLTTSAVMKIARAMLPPGSALERLPWLCVDAIDAQGGGDWRAPELGPESIAFLQYTSGSTSSPKGVVLTHGNLLYNLHSIQHAFGTDENSRGVIWLPPYHDMGLIGGILQPLFAGFPVVLMSPLAMLQRPLRWLRAISHYRATTSGGPNFAYDLCARKIPDDACAGLDLSHWEVAFNGADMVRAGTMERFARKFASWGFRSTAFYPCYGLAEATLIVSGGKKGAGTRTTYVRGTNEPGAPVVHVPASEPDGREYVGCGGNLPGQEIFILEPETGRELGEDRVGEVVVRGPSVAAGYWRRDADTARAFVPADAGTMLRTGDLGFLHTGELYITGRIKDVIIVRGRNYYPHDIEATCERAHADLRPGCGAAFTIEEADGNASLVAAYEVRAPQAVDASAIAARLRAEVAAEHGLVIHRVVLLSPGALPKTSSGKIQRSATCQLLRDGKLAVVAEHAIGDAGDDAAPGNERAPEGEPSAQGAAAEGILGVLRKELAAIGELAADGLGGGDAVDDERPLTTFGLDSVAAVELCHAIERAFGVAVPASLVLGGVSLQGLAAEVERLLSAAATSQDLPPAEDALSDGQAALWFLHRLDPASSAYNVCCAARVHGTINAARLQEALAHLGERHAILRTVYEDSETGPRQRCRSDAAPRFEVVDARAWSEEALRVAVESEAHQPFELSRGPIFRVTLYQREHDRPVLLVVAHHIAVDQWSMAVLLDELATVHAALCRGEPVRLEPLDATHHDFVRWQRHLLAGPDGAHHAAYFHERLAGSLPVLALPSKEPRPAVQTFRGSSHRFSLGAELVGALRNRARDEQVTLFTVLLAGFQVLLARYAGQEDVITGAPMAGRTSARFDRMVGYLVNTLPLRVDLSGNPSVRALIARTNEVLLGALAHQEYPFARLVERLRSGLPADRSPVFQVVFAFERNRLRGIDGVGAFAVGEPGTVVDAGGLALEPYPLNEQSAPFELTLVATEVGERIAAVFRYNTDLFEARQVQAMALHLEQILRGIASSADAPIHALPLLTEAEREGVAAWNRTERPLPGDGDIAVLFAAEAARHGERIAVEAGGVAVSYAELERCANRLAWHLRALGVGPDEMVGVCLERGIEMVVAFLGIIKAGGAYLPLDPGYPAGRLAWMAEDARLEVVVTSTALAAVAPPVRHLVRMDGDQALEQASDAPVPRCEVSGERLAYVLYTSGSTGRPKGVCVENRSVVRLVRNTDYVSLGPEERMAQVSTSTFDAATFEIWGALLNGGRLVVLTREVTLAPATFAAALSMHGITTMVLTTPLFVQMAHEQPGAFRGMRQLLVGGEALDVGAVRRVQEAGPPARLLNAYGPTETTTFATWYEVPQLGADERSVPIGWPIANTTVHVLDAHGSPVPVGVRGELYIGGPGVARGYLGAPDLTAERFVPDPWGTSPEARLYRTGDLGRWRPDGAIEFLGRRDHQVKLRGYRIELGEVETALLACAGVAAAVATVREDRSGDRRLVAYVAPESLDTGALRTELRDRLPEYMVPGVFVVLDEFPLTSSGKIDRQALPAPAAVASPAASPALSGDPRVQILADIFAEVLGVPYIGLHDNFFEHGGHSLLATQVVARVRATLGVELPVRALFEEPTVAGLASRLDGRPAEGLVAIPRVDRTGPLTLSFAQERMWLLEQLAPGTGLYHIPAAVRLRGRLDTAALEAALQEILRRHEGLRTAFAADGGGQPMARVFPAVEAAAWRMQRTDLRAHPARAKALDALRVEEARQPFDLSRAPLLRVNLVALDEDDHELLVTMHHIIADGWSMGVLVQEIQALYESALRGQPPALPALPIQPADVAAWQRAHRDRYDDQIAYWRSQLAGAPPLDLPLDRERPPVRSHAGARVPFALGQEETEALAALGRRSGATLFMVLLSGLSALLSRYSGQDDITIGSPIAGRRHPDMDGLICFFVNTLALRCDLTGEPSFATLLARVRHMTLDAHAHQDAPFEQVVQALQVPRDVGRTPLFQVLLAFQNTPHRRLELPGLTLETTPVDTGRAEFDLTLSVTPGADGLDGWLEYNTDLFERATAERMAAHLRRLLAEAVRQPETPLSTLPLLDAEERNKVLFAFNDTHRPYPAQLTMLDLLVAQVARSPEATALVGETLAGEARSLSYRALHAHAERLAARLRAAGVGPDVLVVVALERSLEMVVALAAVMRAGGAYVPVDPDLPAARVAFLLDDTKAPVLLTQRAVADRLPPDGAVRILLDDLLAGASDDLALPPAPAPGIGPDSLAYVIYTSGSTGVPKGAAIPHRGLVNRLLWMQDELDLRAEDRVLQKTPFSFDVSVWEFFWPLMVGATLVVARAGGHRDPVYLADLIQREQITTIHFVPSMLHAFLDEERAAGCSSLRRIVCSGEALSRELQDRCHARLGATLYNLYGPTEASIDVTYWQCVRGDARSSVPIGRPIANTRLYVLDRHLAPVPIGVPGELYIGGVGLAREYWNRPELTRGRFVPDPWAPEPGARIYKTGDLARYLPDGTIDYLGRLDHQVKIRGHRIELGEIEAALLRHPRVGNAVVTAHRSAQDGDALVAYVVPSAGERPSVGELRAHLAESLPAWMVPAYFLMLDALPLLSNGKLDRRALPAPTPVHAERERTYEPPRTPTEEALAEIWQQILRLDRIGRDDDFFHLGGNSLQAMRVATRVRSELDVDLPLTVFFQTPTIAQLALVITQRHLEQMDESELARLLAEVQS